MLQTYEVILNNGHITWLDNPPTATNKRTRIAFVDDEMTSPNLVSNLYDLNKAGEQRWGFLEGQATIPKDIDWTDDEIKELFGI